MAINTPKPTTEIAANLLNDAITPDAYSRTEHALYHTHLFEQYKLYVESADKISERRNLANSFFLTLNTLLLGAIGLFAERFLQSPWILLLVLPLLGAGLILCYAWGRIIQSYRQLNTGKFKVIEQMENLLPLRTYVKAEWNALGQGDDPDTYMPLTKLETWVPWAFAILYIMMIIAVFVVLSLSQGGMIR
jgi:ABC-type transport system involved in multi-copper enzyme maturation permease subunit